MAPLVRVGGRIVRRGLLVCGVSLARLVVSGVGCPIRLWWFRLVSWRWFLPMAWLDSNF
jgi:hypothetical protein